MNDSFLYFAYGSNMLTHRLRGRAPTARAIGTGFVEGHRLAFDKVSTDGSGKCNIEPTNSPADRVYGVLFRIAASDAQFLDEAEGLGRGYQKRDVRVVCPSVTEAAVAYLADRTNPTLAPYDWYMEFVVRGAIEHSLPGGGVSPDGLRWIGCKKRSFFLPVKVLSSRFRNLFLAYLRKAFKAGRLTFYGELAGLANQSAFEALCRTAKQTKWVVFAKPLSGGRNRC
jgi:hypothetical protein